MFRLMAERQHSAGAPSIGEGKATTSHTNTSGFDSHTANNTKTTTTMTHGVRKIQIQDPNSEATEDIKLYYTTTSMAITIQCADRSLILQHEEIQAITHLMLECFYTRHIIDQALAAPKAPFTIQSSYDEEEWFTRLQEGTPLTPKKITDTKTTQQ